MEQLRYLLSLFNPVRKADSTFMPQFIGVLIFIISASVFLGTVVGPMIVWVPVGVALALLGALLIFARKAQAYQLSQIAGQPGAAMAVLGNMRGAWESTPMVAMNRKQDVIHLLVGRPGVVLVAEGNSPARVKQLLTKETKRFQRAAGEDVPVTTVLVGEEGREGEVSLRKLTSHVLRLPNVIKPNEVGPLHRRLSALGVGNVPMPKGPQMRRGPKKMR